MSLPESFLGDAPIPGPVAIPTPREHANEVTVGKSRTAAKPKLAHSAGPFTVERQSDKSGWTGISIKDGAGLYIANMVMQLAENEMANARLFAASAEMLGALRFILAFYEPGQTHLDTEAWKVAEASARAAVAKAGG